MNSTEEPLLLTEMARRLGGDACWPATAPPNPSSVRSLREAIVAVNGKFELT